jgi:hypothetical protein
MALDSWGGGSDQMQVVFYDDVAKEAEALFPAEVSPRAEYDLHRFRPREHRQPADDGAGHEVGIVIVVNPVACAGHGVSSRRETEFLGRAFPNGVWERGKQADDEPNEQGDDQVLARGLEGLPGNRRLRAAGRDQVDVVDDQGDGPD